MLLLQVEQLATDKRPGVAADRVSVNSINSNNPLINNNSSLGGSFASPNGVSPKVRVQI